jgi:hypothetical protein
MLLVHVDLRIDCGFCAFHFLYHMVNLKCCQLHVFLILARTLFLLFSEMSQQLSSVYFNTFCS